MSQAEEFIKRWMSHRRVLHEMLERIRDEHIDFRPWEGAMTLGELALHIAGAGDMFAAMAKTGGPMNRPQLPECRTMADVRETVRKLTEKTAATLASLTDEELEARYDAHPAFQGPRKALLSSLLEHEAHHKGQLFVYARMVGVEDLPFFHF